MSRFIRLSGGDEMIPITKREEIICENCIWGTHYVYDKVDTLTCEVYNTTVYKKYCCSNGDFPCEVNQDLFILSFEEAITTFGKEEIS
jgi:hypothetical protein